MEFKSGIIDTFVGTGELGDRGNGGLHNLAELNEPFMCAFDSKGDLYFCESRGNRVRKVDMLTGIVSGIAGTGEIGYTGDEGPATEATFNELYGLQVDINGDIYVVDRLNSVVRKIDQSTGLINTVAGTGDAGYSGDGGPPFPLSPSSPVPTNVSIIPDLNSIIIFLFHIVIYLKLLVPVMLFLHLPQQLVHSRLFHPEYRHYYS